MQVCKPVITLVVLLILNLLSIALVFGAGVLQSLFMSTPLAHTLIFILKIVGVWTLCALKMPGLAWFTTALFCLIAFFTYYLSAFVIYNSDTLKPVIADSLNCLKKATTHQEHIACRAKALRELKVKFTPKSDTKSNP